MLMQLKMTECAIMKFLVVQIVKLVTGILKLMWIMELVFILKFYNCYGVCLNDQDYDGVCNELEIEGCRL